MDKEIRIWRGSPAPISVLFTSEGVICTLFVWLGFPGILLLWRFIERSKISYFLTNQRLRVKRGVFNVEIDDIELRRIRDVRIVKPFLYRFFSLGAIQVMSADRSVPFIVVDAILNVEKLHEDIRKEMAKYGTTPLRD